MVRCLVVLALSSFGLFAQSTQGQPVTKPRSNVKDNLVVAGPNGMFTCKLPDAKPCTATDLKDVKLPGIKPLTTKGTTGTITCETTDGKPCNDEQLITVSATLRVKWDQKSGNAGHTTPNANATPSK